MRAQPTAFLTGKRRRGRRESGLQEYQTRTMASIENLKNRLAATKDTEERKKIKNQISAYESRLLKRTAMEKQTLKVQLVNLKLAKLVQLMRDELPEATAERILNRFTAETATWDESQVAAAMMSLDEPDDQN